MSFDPPIDNAPYDEMPEHPSARQLATILPSIEQLATIAQQNALAEPIAHRLVEAFSPHFAKAHELVKQAAGITADPKVARAMRLTLREVRLAAENTRKSFKEGIVREGKAIDGICNVVKFLIEPVEERLENIEKAANHAEESRRAQLVLKRVNALSSLGVNAAFYNLADMPEEQYQELLATSTAAHEERVRQAEAASIERQRADEARRQEEERVRAENARLKQEADTNAEKLRLERVAASEVQRKADLVIAQHRKDRDAAQAALKAEQDAKDKKAKEEAASAAKAARAAERDKLLAYAESLLRLPLPLVTSDDAVEVARDATAHVKEVAAFIRQRCKEL